jgi:hypothetical protein
MPHMQDCAAGGGAAPCLPPVCPPRTYGFAYGGQPAPAPTPAFHALYVAPTRGLLLRPVPQASSWA